MTAGTGKNKADMNVTPLIDILLVLLIIFMVVTPLRPVGLSARILEPDRPDVIVTDADPIVVVSIGPDLEVTINTRRVDFDALGERLADIFKQRADRTIFVRGSADIEFRHVARVIDLAKGAGIQRIGLLSQPN
jgi:biopolymer transport protein ExbD